MAYQELTQYNSPNYTPEAQVRGIYGMARHIEGVTYHWWGDPRHNPRFENVVAYLCRPGGNTSAHVVGEAGRIAWIVDARHAAWHAGHARGNATTIGYECNPRLSDGDYETMGEFHYDCEKAYGRRLSIYVHKDWSATSCSPIDKGRVRAIADRYHAGTCPTPVPAKQPVPEIQKLPEPVRLKMKLERVALWDLETNPHYEAVKMYPSGTVVEATHYIDFNNTRYYLTAYSAHKGLKRGWNKNDVEVIPRVSVSEEVANKSQEVKTAAGVAKTDGVRGCPEPAPVPTPAPVETQEGVELEKRVSALERMVQKIVEFLGGLFKNFGK